MVAGATPTGASDVAAVDCSAAAAEANNSVVDGCSVATAEVDNSDDAVCSAAIAEVRNFSAAVGCTVVTPLLCDRRSDWFGGRGRIADCLLVLLDCAAGVSA